MRSMVDVQYRFKAYAKDKWLRKIGHTCKLLYVKLELLVNPVRQRLARRRYGVEIVG